MSKKTEIFRYDADVKPNEFFYEAENGDIISYRLESNTKPEFETLEDSLYGYRDTTHDDNGVQTLEWITDKGIKAKFNIGEEIYLRMLGVFEEPYLPASYTSVQLNFALDWNCPQITAEEYSLLRRRGYWINASSSGWFIYQDDIWLAGLNDHSFLHELDNLTDLLEIKIIRESETNVKMIYNNEYEVSGTILEDITEIDIFIGFYIMIGTKWGGGSFIDYQLLEYPPAKKNRYNFFLFWNDRDFLKIR